MTTGRINQVAPSRTTAGVLPGGPSTGGTAPRGSRAGRVVLRAVVPAPRRGGAGTRAGDPGDGEGRRPPRARSGDIESESAPGAPAARRRGRARSGTGRARRRGGRGPGYTAAGRGAVGPRRSAGIERCCRPGRCSRSGAGIGAQATRLAPRAGGGRGHTEGTAARRSDATRHRARRGRRVQDNSRADTVTRRARAPPPGRGTRRRPGGRRRARRHESALRRGAKAPPSASRSEHRACAPGAGQSRAAPRDASAHNRGTGRPRLRA